MTKTAKRKREKVDPIFGAIKRERAAYAAYLATRAIQKQISGHTNNQPTNCGLHAKPSCERSQRQ
jgi:hypothetical protein